MARASRLLSLAVGVALASSTAGSVVAIDDTTAPAGAVAVVHDDRVAELVRLSVAATDDLSGVATVEVSGDGSTWASFPYAPEVDWAAFDPLAGGDPELGIRTVRVRWTDGMGNTSDPVETSLYLSENGALEFPESPVTGELFTIKPIYEPGETPPSNSDCSWEMRWGDEEALRENKPNETFGTMFMSGRPDRGFCGSWTFTVPWVPVRQFEIYFNSLVMSTADGPWAKRAKFYPDLGSTDRRIRESNLPMVQVLPDKYTIAVGEPVTYTAYPIGTHIRDDDTWIAYCPDFNCNGQGISWKIKYGGSKFTFTPPFTGTWLVVWNGISRPFGLNAGYDPKVRRADRTDPTTTTPKQRIGGGTPGPTVPVTLEWSGSDVGWGIEKFRLERSVDDGAWIKVALPAPKTKSIVQELEPGTEYRYRVRAVDRAGNVGSWKTGPAFRPRLVDDADPDVTYLGSWSPESDPAAIGSALQYSDSAGAEAELQFVGRDVAWIAERGPGMGLAKVYVDGDLVATVDLSAVGDEARQVVLRRHWATKDAHAIRVVVNGPAGVTIDAFAILR
jgi:fibronectin type III domain protein